MHYYHCRKTYTNNNYNIDYMNPDSMILVGIPTTHQINITVGVGIFFTTVTIL